MKRSTWRKGIIGASLLSLVTLSAACGAASSGGGDTYSIGAVLPLSGSGQPYGLQDEKMIKLAIANIEASHLIKGKLQAYYSDSQALPAPAVSAAEQAVTVHHVVALQTLFTAPVTAEVPIANRNKILEINVGASGPNLDGLSPYLVSVLPLGNQQVASYAKWAVQKAGLKRWVVLYTTEELGQGLLKALQADVPADGGQIVKTISVSPNATEYSSQEALIRSAVANQPGTVVYLAVSGLLSGNIQQIISALAAQGVKATYTSYNGSLTPALEADKAAAGFQYTGPAIDLTADNSVTQQFIRSYEKSKPGSSPSSIQSAEVEDYNGMWLIGEAIHYCQAHNEDVNGSNMRKALKSMGDIQVVGGHYRVSSGGTVSVPIEVEQMQPGGDSKVVFQP